MTLAVAPVVVGPSVAAAEESGATAAAHTSGLRGCDLKNPNMSPLDEWGRCMTVTAELSDAPGKGETAMLSYEVNSTVPMRDAAISVALPKGMAFVGVPDGAALADVRTGRGTGPATVATVHRDLASDQAQRFTTPVRAVTGGPVEIVVRVTVPRPDGGTDAAEDRVFLTVGGSGASSKLGIETDTELTTTTAPPAADRGPDTSTRHRAVPQERPLPPAQVPANKARGADHASLAIVCSTGFWSYTDTKGVQRPSSNFGVEVWDADATGGADLLASSHTIPGGRYDLCYDNTDADEGGLVDPFVRFVAANSRWRVRNTPASNQTYAFATETVNDQAQNHDFGDKQPGDSSGMRILRAFDAVNQFWNWVPSSCWDANDAPSACRQIVINWTPTSTDGTYYSTVTKDIHLAAADPDSAHVVIHEATHSVMDDVYEDAYPAHPNCSPHNIDAVSSPGCAWTEGFAEWVPASVLKDPYYRWPDGGELPLETPTWGTPGWGIGIAVEGRVAGAMIDIEDLANEQIWDRANEGDHRNQWATFINGSAQTYYMHFEYDRVRMGYETSDSGSRASAYQNTLGISFYDPLGDRAELTRPTPTPHNYRYDTNRPAWSAVAVRPPAGSNYDLELYDSRSDVGLLDASRLGSNTLDYVMVDSRRRALGDYYAKVTATSGAGNYQVELAQGGQTITDGSEAIYMGDEIAVRDTPLEPGVTTYFRVVPANASQDPELNLHTQLAGTTSPVQARWWASETGSSFGPGLPETLSYTSSISQWGGLVITNRAGSGEYTVYRDTTAPTGSVVINGGAASTTSRNVTLALTAADAQTGIQGVKISTDGSLDTEPVQPFSATRAITLPAGSGTKTVLVQCYNRAGMPSLEVSDTISLTTGVADLRVSALANPPTSKARGRAHGHGHDHQRGHRGCRGVQHPVLLVAEHDQGCRGRAARREGGLGDLAAGSTSSGSRAVTIPTGAPAGTFFLLACSDDQKWVPESNEANNCRASARAMRVT